MLQQYDAQADLLSRMAVARRAFINELLEPFGPPEAMATQPTELGHGRPAQPEVTP